jgi:hypothetical protein
VKMLGGVGLLCLSVLWALFWCIQLSHPMVAYYTEYKVLFILVASLAIIPLFWGTSLLDQAIRAPIAPEAAPEWLVTPPLQNFHIEPPKVDSETQLAGLSPDAPPLPDRPDGPEVAAA